LPPDENEEETEKRLGALLREGTTFISLDNVNGELGGDALAQLTERPLVRVRVLGVSEAPEFECKSTVFATGNNTVVIGDMTRRVLFCTLDPKCERPELRTFEFKPVDRVLANRAAYVAAVLTIARAYEAANSPRQSGMTSIGSYEEWSRRVREPLVWLGEADPVQSMETARDEDPELAKLRNMMAAWRGAIGIGYDYARRVREVIEAATEFDVDKLAHPELNEALSAVALRGKELNVDMLGRWLRWRKGRIVEGLRFTNKRDDKHGSMWWLEQMDSKKPSDEPPTDCSKPRDESPTDLFDGRGVPF
jgi:putative DNA primase/helicase